MSICQRELKAQGKAYPRTCPTCGLFGKCHKGLDDPLKPVWEEIARVTTDHGKTIEAGWIALKELTLQGAPEIQVREMRKAFFAGAQHLFASISNLLDDDEEVTGDDLRRMEMIHVELEAWVDSMKREARGIKDPI